MKRLIILIFTFACVSLLFAGTAFAGTAPDAASYLTHSGYNKTYAGEDGTSHTMTVKWVGETWNNLGTVIYSINYEDVYQKDGNTYIDVMSATEIYENARPTYPDSPQHNVYQVKWYVDGSKEVVSDYRPAEPEQTSSPTQTEQPEATAPSETATPSPTQPSVPSAIPITTPSAEAGDAVTANPDKNTTPTPESSSTPGSSAASVSPTPLGEMPAVTSEPMPDVAAAQENMTGGSAVPSLSAPAPEKEPENVPQNTDASRWIWPVIVFSGIGAAVWLALYRRRKEGKDHEEHKA